MKLEDSKIKEFQDKMLTWFEENGRDFPWRETTDPYQIMVAEFLLQKTHVRKVEEVYFEITENYPNLFSLSQADQKELEEIIRPLGFINRAERLIDAAKKIIDEYDGIIPDDFEELLSINGIGSYIATAILIFAYDKKKVVVDTNVIRILEIELDIKSDKKRPRTDKDLWATAQRLAPEHRIKEFNWALLDYGAFLSSNNTR